MDNRPLWSTGFIGVLLTQFLGSFNDNMLRWLSVCVGEQFGKLSGTMNEEALASWKTLMLVLGGVSFTLPYLFLMPLAGSLADRFSKRSVMVTMKVAEIAIMFFAVTMIAKGQIWFMFLSVGLMGAQSALFGPSRFGLVCLDATLSLFVSLACEGTGVEGIRRAPLTPSAGRSFYDTVFTESAGHF